jgi:hypothetical protein
VTYTGTASTNAITGLGFSPDWLWIKGRSAALWHNLFDTVRGNNKILYSNATNAEESEATASLTSFDSNGFTLSSNGSTGVGNTNGNGTTYVAWAWDAGTSTASNTDGSITSSVRANASAGFSIVSYTGTGSAETIGHSLNDAPHLVIIKERDTPSSGVSGWMTYHKGVGDANKYLRLEGTAAASTASAVFGSDPTASVFSIGNDREVSDNTKAFIAYCFAPVAGYSAFGSYTGNGASGYPNADGPFVFTGMRPRFVLIKATSQAENWVIYDTARSTFNVLDDQLYPNANTAETSGANREIDVYSNGFKIRSNSGQVNSNNATYIYAAFAEHPFKTARAR